MPLESLNKSNEWRTASATYPDPVTTPIPADGGTGLEETGIAAALLLGAGAMVTVER